MVAIEDNLVATYPNNNEMVQTAELQHKSKNDNEVDIVPVLRRMERFSQRYKVE